MEFEIEERSLQLGEPVVHDQDYYHPPIARQFDRGAAGANCPDQAVLIPEQEPCS